MYTHYIFDNDNVNNVAQSVCLMISEFLVSATIRLPFLYHFFASINGSASNVLQRLTSCLPQSNSICETSCRVA